MNCFLFVEVSSFPNNIIKIANTKRYVIKIAFFISILYCYNTGCPLYFIIDFNVERDIFPDCVDRCYWLVEFESKIELWKSNR